MHRHPFVLVQKIPAPPTQPPHYGVLPLTCANLTCLLLLIAWRPFSWMRCTHRGNGSLCLDVPCLCCCRKHAVQKEKRSAQLIMAVCGSMRRTVAAKVQTCFGDHTFFCYSSKKYTELCSRVGNYLKWEADFPRGARTTMLTLENPLLGADPACLHSCSPLRKHFHCDTRGLSVITNISWEGPWA